MNKRYYKLLGLITLFFIFFCKASLAHEYYNILNYDVNTTKNSVDYILYISAILMLIIVIKCLAIHNQYKTSINSVVKTMMFHPPANLNPSEIGYIYNKNVNNKDITSFIIYWASKGFINIKEEVAPLVVGFKFKKYYLTKIKGIETNDSYERNLFDGMFKYASGNVLDISNLQDKFYRDVNKAKKSVKSKVNKEVDVYDKSFRKMILIIIIISSAVFGIATYDIFLSLIGNIEESIKTSIYITIFQTAFFVLFTIKLRDAISDRDVYTKIIDIISMIVIILLTGIIASLIVKAYPFAIESGSMLLTYSILHIINMFLVFNTFKLTKGGTIILGEILGFKEFLDISEKEQLDALADETASYFYSILPYAIVLDGTNKWAYKFNDLVSEPPSWYSSNDVNTFSPASFATSISNSMSSMSNTMSSYPSS
ncbi:MAG TPA: hypothetical protein DCP90_09355 [Clostridiales bacterium]|nr:MAG: hypothetical protein A2Y22_04745 [Clostridiales bacterium GWD2_32_59]HAN10799.1 hypothetical protein [Clostridiales bacterium]